MYIVNSKITSNKHNDEISSLLDINEEYLRQSVETIAVPRHRIAERNNNEAVANWIEKELKSFACTTFRQGDFNNVVGMLQDSFEGIKIIIGAHFDSVPKSPGADDNASAVVGMLAAAKALSKFGNMPVAFVAFNQEEDGLLGSKDFVENFINKNNYNPELVHILEMIGFCDKTSGSQKVPPGLPIKISDKGDFIAVIANKSSNKYISSVMKLAPQDTPDTLDYEFMKHVTQLVVVQVLEYLEISEEIEKP